MDPSKQKIVGICIRMVERILHQGHICGFSDSELDEVLHRSSELLAQEPTLLELTPPLIVVGDTHGQLKDLIKWFTVLGFPSDQCFLFLGDYVDRCKKSLEVIMLLLCYKILYPGKVYLLRGNHECSKMNRIYGFYEELRRKRSSLLWKKFNDVFNELPLCAVVSSRILCMHGGISDKATSWEELRSLAKPKTPRQCDDGLAQDLMWSDPSNDKCCNQGFQFNSLRACSVIFDETAVNRICSSLNIDFVCRAHEIVAKGHQWHFNNRLVTIFSAPNYCGAEGNCGSVMHVSSSLEVWFTTLQPIIEKSALTEAQMELLKKQMTTLEAKSPDPNKVRKEDSSINVELPTPPTTA